MSFHKVTKVIIFIFYLGADTLCIDAILFMQTMQLCYNFLILKKKKSAIIIMTQIDYSDFSGIILKVMNNQNIMMKMNYQPTPKK